MTTMKRVLLITVLFVAALTGLRLFWIGLIAPSADGQAVQGQLDLRNWDFGSNRTVALNGEWEFYPHRLLLENKETDYSGQPDGEFVQIPEMWNRFMSDERSATFGYGSYRLRIKVQPDKERIYGIQVPAIPASSELYVNGRLVANSGQPAADEDAYTPRRVPYSATFATDRSEIELIVQVANYDELRAGGMHRPIKFGSDLAVNRAAGFSAGLQVTVCLILLLHAVYAVILYFMGVREKALLYFFLLIICTITSILIDDNGLLLVWLPIDYDSAFRIYYLVYLGIAVFIFQYAKHLLPEYKIVKGLRSYTAICAVYAAFVPFLPIAWLKLAGYFHFAIVLVPFLIVPLLAFITAIRGHKDVIFILLGMSAVSLNIIWGAIKNLGPMEMGYYPFDMIAAFIAFASYWFRRYLRSSAQTAKLAEKLLEEDKRKDQFLANTSHELRNPLHGILNIAQTLLVSNGILNDGRNRESIRMLVSVGKRMSFLLNDLLDITRLKENRVRLQLTNVRIQGVASGVCDMVRLMTEGKKVLLVNNIPAVFPRVIADENRLIQILFNLLHNAVKFTNEGTITVDARVEDGQAVILVSDTGIGMDEATLGRMFEPYEQGGSDYAEGAGGLGLGLSICKQLVELHQGTISASSIPDRGSVFTFTLPLSDAAIPQIDTAISSVQAPVVELETAAAAEDSDSKFQPISGRAEERSYILVIDDDPVNLSILETVLSSENYEVVKATSGKEGLSLLAEREWDLMIADVMMPHMSGYQLSRNVREHFTISELPILLLTARSRPEDIEAGFQAGANDYLIKPVDAWELKSRVRALTDNKKSFRERLRVEAAWLQAQIQPHFLFNTLNSIAALSEFDTTRMRTLLEVFGDYLRASFTLRNMERLVPLKYEMDLVRSYLYIEKERFDDRLHIFLEVDENIEVNIPPLTIQPLVENAVKHGVLIRTEGGKVYIRIVENKDHVEVSVEDDGVGMDERKVRQLLSGQAAQGTGIGLRNTDRRLKQLYGQGLHIDSTLGEGTKISFIVKKIK
ncbi:ATP-binding protein [Paenibacillus contaminans]|uniref:histidine kinase n=1 Tax=Paenibacillus contaminans TaxID=450362 RepID=A0A329MMY2_9BACL|nr:ATP-binding protein [Paenibacillus contaminans]RAV21124.1 histidine kinase [Paenibacillus contaminans]